MGFLGVSLFLFCFLFIIIYGFIQTKKLSDHAAKLLGMGILLLFTFQSILHICVNMGLLPTTGINLPLVSYGGNLLDHLFPNVWNPAKHFKGRKIYT